MGNCLYRKTYIGISYEVLGENNNFDINKYKSYLERLFQYTVYKIDIDNNHITLFYSKNMSKGVLRRKLNILLPSGINRYGNSYVFIKDKTFDSYYLYI